MRRAFFYLSDEVLKECLHMPKESVILGIDFDHMNSTYRLFVQSEELQDVPEGQVCPCVSPSVSVEEVDGKPVYTWSWNIQKAL